MGNEKLNFEQYRMAIEAAEKVTDRRNDFNKFFITILTLFMTALGLLSKFNENLLLTFILLVLAIIACSIWKEQLQCFKKLIEIKYGTVTEMEKEFEIRNTHSQQYEKIEELKKLKKMKSFTDQEKAIATIFQCGFSIYLLFIITNFLLSPCFISVLISLITGLKNCNCH